MGGPPHEAQQEKLEMHIRTFLPDSQGTELDWRMKLLRARGFATEMVADTTDDFAYTLASEALEVAKYYVFAEVPEARLALATKLCRCLVQSAFIVDHLAGEAPHA